MLIQATIASYFALFMTDTFMVPAAAASVIMFFATLWDAINDPIMGGICDRTRSKWGRYRPYLLFIPILLTIVTYFLFLNPQGLTDSQKIAYITVFYVLYGMLTTALTMPQMALLPTLTKSDNERNQMVTLGVIMVAVSFTIASSFTTNFVSFFGGSYAPLMLIYGALAIIANLLLFKNSKERFLEKTEKRSVVDDLKILFRHKELLSILIVWCMASLGYGLMFSSSVYYIMYYMVRPDLIPMYMLTLSVGALVSMMIIMPLFLRLFKSAEKVLQVSQTIALVCYIMLFIVGRNSLILLFVLSFIATATASMEQGLINILLNDTIDYIQLTEKVSINGMLAAIKGFAYKCGTTLTSSGILAVLALTGYIAGAVGHQPESAMIGINILRFALPAATCIIIIVCLMFYPIRKYKAEIEEMKRNMTANDEEV
ncbi:MAG: MFS transporter [Lachnospiraceae bacterium]